MGWDIMNRNETLDYLEEKRIALAPVAIAQQERDSKRYKSEKAEKRLRKTIIGFWVVGILFYLTGLDGQKQPLLYVDENGVQQLNNVGALLLMVGIAAIIMAVKYKFWVKPAHEILDEANQKLRQEENMPAYIEGRNGFPEEFYTYSDAYRLWKLVNEGRAESLREAYNLLEKQNFYEDQLAIQEETRSLQADTAASAKIAAIAATVAAVNTTNNK